MNYNEALEFLFKNLPNYQNLGNSDVTQIDVNSSR